jgi:hypothetical protein
MSWQSKPLNLKRAQAFAKSGQCKTSADSIARKYNISLPEARGILQAVEKARA